MHKMQDGFKEKIDEFKEKKSEIIQRYFTFIRDRMHLQPIELID